MKRVKGFFFLSFNKSNKCEELNFKKIMLKYLYLRKHVLFILPQFIIHIIDVKVDNS